MCSVLLFGAMCDNATDDTLAIQRALDACNYTGSVSLPAGRCCLSFPLTLHNGTALYLPAGSRLKAFPDVGRWPNTTMFNFVELRHKRDISIWGEGTIDGSGDMWWVHASATVRPRLFHMSNVANVSFQGITLTHSGAMTLSFGSPCSNVLVDRVTIVNPAVGNTDGIDMGCDGAVIQHTTVINGDDSICMKGGAKNVLVTNCSVFNGEPFPGSQFRGLAGGLVLGTSDDDSMQNITYSNCSVHGALAGIRIKYRPSQHGYVRGVRFERIRIHRPVAYAVDVLLDSNHLDDDAPARRGAAPGFARAHTVNVTDVKLLDISGELGLVPPAVCGEGKTCPRAVGRFRCTANDPCQGIALQHFNVTGFIPSSEFPAACSWNHTTGSSVDVYPVACRPPAP